MGCGRKTAKILMLFGNTLFLLAGISLMSLGGYIRYLSKDYDTIVGKNGIAMPANIMIAAGVVVFLVSFLGCVGAIKENKCLLTIFIIFVVLILLLEVGGVGVAFYYKSEVEKAVTDGIVKAVQKTYGQTGQDVVTKAVDEIQTRLKCCGANNFTDWFHSTWAKSTNSTNKTPMSCKEVKNKIATQYLEGCVIKAKDWASNNLLIVGGVGCAVLVIEMLAVWFATILLKREDSVGPS